MTISHTANCGNRYPLLEGRRTGKFVRLSQLEGIHYLAKEPIGREKISPIAVVKNR